MRQGQSESRWGRSSSFTKETSPDRSSDGFTPVQGVAKRNSSSLKRSGLSRFYDKKARSFACLNEVTELARLYGDSDCARILSKLSNSTEPAPARPTLSAPASPTRSPNHGRFRESKEGCDTCTSNVSSAGFVARCRCRPSPTQHRSAEHMHTCQDYGIQSMCLALERAHVTADGDPVVKKKGPTGPEVLWTCWEIAA